MKSSVFDHNKRLLLRSGHIPCFLAGRSSAGLSPGRVPLITEGSSAKANNSDVNDDDDDDEDDEEEEWREPIKAKILPLEDRRKG